MDNIVKKLRKSTNKTQKEFASTYNIPLSTLKKWEQNESNPAPYVLYLLSSSVDRDRTMIEISDMEHAFYYDPLNKTVYNKKGDGIKIDYDIFEVKKNNLLVYLEVLFEKFEEMKSNFLRDCELDKKEDITWIRMN